MDGCTFTFKDIEDHVAKVKQKALTSAMRNNPVYGPFSEGMFDELNVHYPED